jgi:DNA-binding GntR family transcriptional regulator
MSELNKIHFKSPQSVREAILTSLRKAIIAGDLQPQERITERMLSDHFQTSTTPVKEALRILQSEGLVEVSSRSGTIVSSFANMRLTEIYMIRAALEGVAANFAASKASDDEISEMERILEKSKSLIDSGEYEKLIANNTKFHQSIRSASQNSYLEHLIKGVLSYDALFRQVVLTLVNEQKIGWKEHVSVLEAIKNCQPEEAETRLRNHIIRSGQEVLAMQSKTSKSGFGITIKEFFSENSENHEKR